MEGARLFVNFEQPEKKREETAQSADLYRRQLEVVCNNATLAIFIMNEQQQCTYMNPAAEKLTGYSLAEVQGRALHDIIHHTHPDGTPYPLEECPIDRALPQNNQEQGEEVFVHKDGHFYPVAYTASPIRDASGIVGTIIEVRDISEEKAAAQAREELDRAKTIFFSNVSHEFRTPLTLMLSPLEEMLAAATEDERSQLEAIYRNGQRLLKLVNTLLDFSRIEAGRIQAAYEPIDLARFTIELASSFQSALVQAGIRFTIDCPPLSEAVYVDRDMWEKIVLNLLSNAFKFTLAGEISVRLREQGDRVELTVQDTGVGIPAEALPHLFDRFYRVPEARGRSYEGSGIGLSLVQELVKLHSGTIAVSSQLDQGTTFTVSIPTGSAHLPIDRITPSTPRPVNASAYITAAGDRQSPVISKPILDQDLPEQTSHRRTAHILLADDNSDMRDYIRRLLSQQYAVTAVADGEAAIAQIRQQQPDLILSDVMMPKLDGFGLLAALRADAQLQHIPVILLSARAGEEARIEGLQAGADDYIIKPFTARELLARVDAALERDRLRKQAESALRDREQFFKNLTNTVPISLWTARPDGALDFISQPWLDYTGMNFDPENQASWAEVLHPDDRAMTNDRWLTCIRSGDSAYEVTHRVRRADGEYRWCITCALLTRDSQGNPLRWYGSTIDIHGQKQIETALSASEERFRLATQAVDALVFDYDVQTGEVYRSEKLYDLIGVHPEAAPVAAQWWFDRIHPDDAARLQTLRPSLFDSTIDRYETEYRVRHADNRWITVWEQGCLLRNEAGAVMRIVGATKDISDRKQAEQQLQEAYEELAASNEELQVAEEELRQQNEELAIAHQTAAAEKQRYQDLFSFAPDGYVVTDTSGKIEEANQAIATLLRVQPADLLKQPLANYVPVDDRFTFRSLVYLLKQNPQRHRQTDELHLQPLSGNPFPAAITIAAVCDRQNQAIALRWMIRDISDRQRSESALRDRETRLRLILESAKDYAIITLDLNGRLTSWNTGAQRLLGYTEAEIIGQHGRIIFTPEDQAAGKAEEEMRIALAQGRAENERWHVRKDQSCFWGSGLVMPMHDEARNVQGLLKIMQDKTAERQAAQEREALLERERAAREQAEAANRIKDEFLAVLSHELRTPLNPILGWSQLLRGGKLDATKTNQALEAIERNARLQTQLIEDLLDVSRILRGKLSLNMEPVPFASIIEAAIDTVRLAAEAKSIRIHVDLAAIDPVLGDAARLQQIVWNLLTNAIKFTPSGGRVEVKLAGLEDEAERMQSDRPSSALGSQPVARLTVSDTGIGISPDFLPHMFDYFRQADGATTRKFGGLGLGLAIVRNLVELHGGSVSASSAGEGQGATFTVELPLLKTADPRPLTSDLPASSSDFPLAGVQILLVDDEADTRDVTAFTLEAAGAIVTQASSAIEALQIFETVKPNLLISDIGMPQMDGYALMQQLRSNLRQTGTKAIALTAYAGEINQRQAIAAGFQRHLAKPVDPDELIATIAALLDREFC
ncbi:PAS domain S-box protein [Microcoleus sp. FACHB-1515]|uniref:PAS domain S-box protein n=1 Tax=Cyanophyceae TaxID=3028117 RepID=UPI00168402EA|nr:PAS domain S-box protein [Microcoleus sp. FACHB-1515]MBD2090698.1 PAS domain S-box protein [Microcoleus sp. FACHB-1515]